jgi:hypothetical protein
VRVTYKNYIWASVHFSISFILQNFRHNLFSEICALIGRYATSSGNPLPTFRDSISGLLTLEDGTDTLSLNVGKGLPLNVA